MGLEETGQGKIRFWGENYTLRKTYPFNGKLKGTCLIKLTKLKKKIFSDTQMLSIKREHKFI